MGRNADRAPDPGARCLDDWRASAEKTHKKKPYFFFFAAGFFAAAFFAGAAFFAAAMVLSPNDLQQFRTIMRFGSHEKMGQAVGCFASVYEASKTHVERRPGAIHWIDPKEGFGTVMT